MANALSFSPPLRYGFALHSVLHQHFLYHMYIHVVSVVCYNSLCFLPLLKFFIFWYRDLGLDVNFMGGHAIIGQSFLNILTGIGACSKRVLCKKP